MERIIRYFDQIKADEELKEKTKSYIRERIAAENEKNDSLTSNPYSSKKRKYTLRRWSLAALSIAACLIIMIGGYAYYKTPINYISLDINPSVELGLNRFGRVIETEAINADGNSLLNGTKILNMSADDAIEELSLKAEEKGYIRDDGSTVIAVTALSKQYNEAAKIRDQADKTLRTMISKGTLNAIVYTDSADLLLRTEARGFGLSPGKYKLILLLQSLDSGVEIDQYRNTRITDILVKANELLQQNDNTGSGRYEWNYEMIKEAAEQIWGINGNIIREQNTEQNQNRSSSPSAVEQDQEQNQNQNGYIRQPNAIDQNNGSVNIEQEPGANQDQSQNQATSSSGVGQEQTYNQNQMTSQPTEGQGQSNQQDVNSGSGQEKTTSSGQSSGETGGNQDNKQKPN
ncbi:hypothetical protein [Sinanaerobacter chloroacetimidivorans]|uniref:Anti-sigma factor RsgI-like middle domain-containing protein n=1 Tax=Sinanaerobacter chloroacetimidivorans TaxID=2818044 RepID=A0A8J8B295_9FIRM|nr:hypothetical protein [Sinanaerobacter chloroacetimidivorans]MBR0598492.1 hypothetical protein [Sinanaerobacter chloroacetimidivorans]